MALSRTAPQSATLLGLSKAETSCWAQSTLDSFALSRSSGAKHSGRRPPRRRSALLEIPMPNSTISGHGSETDSSFGSRPSTSAPMDAPQLSAHDMDLDATISQLATVFGLKPHVASMPDLHRGTASRPSSRCCHASARLASLTKGRPDGNHAEEGESSCSNWPRASQGRREWRQSLATASEPAVRHRRRSIGGTTPVGSSRKFADFSGDGDSRRVGSLALKYRLPLAEVTRLSNAVGSMKLNAFGLPSDDEFRRCLCLALGVREVAGHVWQDARATLLTEHEMTLNDFVAWYVQNMFLHVNGLTGSEDRCASDALVYKLARTFGTKADAIDRIKAEFDRFDLDGDGSLDREEFHHMLCSMLNADASDFNERRMSHYWNEMDINSDGTIDLAEFCKWHLKYFNPNGLSSGLVTSLYDSYNPDVQRRNCLKRIAGA